MRTGRRRATAIGTLVLIPLLISTPPAGGADDPVVELDKIVATIDGEPVLLSDILLEIDLGLLTVAGEKAGIGDYIEPYLNRLLITREVEDVGGYRLTPSEESSGYEGYLSRYSRRQEYENKLRLWGITENEVKTRLNRALLASLYTESRVQFFVSVLPTDVENAYRQDPDRWDGRSLYEAWDDVRRHLVAEAFQKELTRWVETLRTRYELVRVRERNRDQMDIGSDDRPR